MRLCLLRCNSYWNYVRQSAWLTSSVYSSYTLYVRTLDRKYTGKTRKEMGKKKKGRLLCFPLAELTCGLG